MAVFAAQSRLSKPVVSVNCAKLRSEACRPYHQTTKRFRRLYSDRARPRLIETSGDYDLPPFVSQFGITSIPPDPSEKKAELQFAAQFIRYRPGGMRKVSPDLQDHEVLVWFNLQWPIEAQLNSARQVLEQQIKAKNLAGAPFRFRYRPEKYANYLRVLDAKATNMSDEAIASVIYPNLPDSHPEHAGSHRSVTTLRRQAPPR